MRASYQTQMVLLALLDSPEEDAYGFSLSRATGLKTGTLYPILDRLHREGWVTSRWEEIDIGVASRRRRRYYRFTPKGEREARTAVADAAIGLRQLMPGLTKS